MAVISGFQLPDRYIIPQSETSVLCQSLTSFPACAIWLICAGGPLSDAVGLAAGVLTGVVAVPVKRPWSEGLGTACRRRPGQDRRQNRGDYRLGSDHCGDGAPQLTAAGFLFEFSLGRKVRQFSGEPLVDADDQRFETR